MKYYFSLKIESPQHTHSLINTLLDVNSNTEFPWEYEVVVTEKDDPFCFIDEFLKILEGKEAELASIGISTDNITFWMLYEYDGQCNMEFSPVDMKRLGEKGYTLCISCYESGV